MARNDSVYDASPRTVNSPLTPNEVSALLAEDGRSLLRDAPRLQHFLRRVAVTIDAYRAQITQMSRDVQMSRISRETAGRASTLSPLDSARFAPPEELAKLVDGATGERFRLANEAYRAAEALRATTMRDYQRLKFDVTGLLEDDALPAALRQRIQAVLDAIESPSDLTAPAQAAQEAMDRAAPYVVPSGVPGAVPDAASEDAASDLDELRDLFS